MKKINPIVLGTLILTVSGFITKIIGFLFRIFLSRSIGAEGMGIYQMVFPLFAFFHSISCSGIEIAISKYVAEAKDKSNKLAILIHGSIISLTIATFCSICMYVFSDKFAIYLLNEERTAALIKCLSYTLIFSVIHSCINGYYLGQKKAAIPGISNLIEQIVKTLTIFVIVKILSDRNASITPIIAIYGTLAGEIIAALFTFASIRITKIKSSSSYYKKILKMSLPITFNSALVTLLLSIEAILIPYFLKKHGYTIAEALSTYGILTGMSIPLIMFPASFITSMSTMVLPVVSEVATEKKDTKLKAFIENIISFCLISGIFSTFIFINYGNKAGFLIFGIEEVSTYITILAWLCPFMYISINLKSIINGLGNTKITFAHNLITTTIKILFTVFLVPFIGIKGYLWGLLFSQICLCLLHFYYLATKYNIVLNAYKNIVLPTSLSFISIVISKPFYFVATKMTGHLSYPAIIIPCIVSFTFYMLTCKLFFYNN